MSNLDGKCNYVAVTRLEGSEVAAATYYRVSVAEIQQASNNLRTAFILNAYCEHFLNKPAVDITSPDVDRLRSSRQTYESWAASKKLTAQFADVIQALNVLVNRL